VRTLDETTLDALIDEGLMRYLAELLSEEDQPQKFLYFYHRTRPILQEIFHALREEFLQSQFTIAGVEVSISDRGTYPPLVLPVGSECSIKMVGKIDRLDRCTMDGTDYFRVVDYKSGGKQFDFDEAAAGLNLQMLLYLFAIADSSGERPAGVLYMPAGAPKPVLERDADEGERQKARDRSYAMNGLLLDDDLVLRAMEQHLAGRFLPISQGKSGKKGKYLVSREQLSDIRGLVYDRVIEMGEAIFSGRIAPDPVLAGNFSPCAFCEYRAVCGHEDVDGYRTLEKNGLPQERRKEENTNDSSMDF
jgi:ATP-dependent helicase/nuclease subunit B